MKNKTWIRLLAAYYFLIASLIWLTLGVYSLLEGEIILSGTIEGWSDVVLILLVWMLPFVIGIYFVFSQRLHRLSLPSTRVDH